MPRNMSFSMTKPQVRARTKTVTRRVGWLHARAGHIYNAVEKGMGLKPGEKIVRMDTIRVISARRERIDAITPEDVIAEGFPGWTTDQFIELYCKANRQKPDDLTTRIEFEYVDG